MGGNENTDLIERYLNNQLNSEEKTFVELRISNDDNFKKEFENLLILKESIKYNSLQDKKKILINLEAQLNAKNQNFTISNIQHLKTYLIAASFIGVIAISFLIISNLGHKENTNYAVNEPVEVENKEITSIIKDTSYKPKENIIKKSFLSFYLKPELIAIALRSDSEDSIQNVYKYAIQQYNKNNYKAVLLLLNKTNSLEQEYLKAHCYFISKDYKEAEKMFKKLGDDEYFENQKAAEWFLLLTYLNLLPDKLYDAKLLAKKITNDDDSKYKSKSKTILNLLQ